MDKQRITIMNSTQMVRFDYFVIWFCTIDILFLTYLPFVCLTISTPIIILWVMRNSRKLIEEREYQYCLFLLLIMLISIVWGAISDSRMLWSNIKVWLIQALCYHYYFMYKYYKTKYSYSVNVKRLLEIFLILGFILAIFYISNRGGFILFKRIVNRYDGVVGGIGAGYTNFRYNFLWTDANNPAYAFSAVMTFLLIRYKFNIIEKTVIIICALVPILASMSTGGLTCFILGLCLVFGSFVIRTIRDNHFCLYISWKGILLMAFLLIVLFLAQDYINTFFNDVTIQQSLDRTSSNDSQMEFRINIWKDILDKAPIYKRALLGVGPSIIINGIARKPHSGFLYLVYSYGILATYMFLKLFFFKAKSVKWDSYFYMFPIWIGFIINGIIGNPKFMVLIILMAVETKFSDDTQYFSSKNSKKRNYKI